MELTDYCLNSCLYCSSWSGSKNNTMLDFETIKAVLNVHKPEWVNLSGGEPLLYSNIFNLLDWLKSQEYKIRVYTSGHLSSNCCHRNFTDFILSYLKKIGISSLIVNYHSMHEQIFDFMTQTPDSFKLISRFISIAQLYDLPLEAHIVPTTVNIKTLDETIDFLLKTNFSKVSLLKLVKQGRCVFNEFLIPKEYPEIHYIEVKYKNLVRLGFPWKKDDEPCACGQDKLVITPKSIIIPCEAYKDGTKKCSRHV